MFYKVFLVFVQYFPITLWWRVLKAVGVHGESELLNILSGVACWKSAWELVKYNPIYLSNASKWFLHLTYICHLLVIFMHHWIITTFFSPFFICTIVGISTVCSVSCWWNDLFWKMIWLFVCYTAESNECWLWKDLMTLNLRIACLFSVEYLLSVNCLFLIPVVLPTIMIKINS